MQYRLRKHDGGYSWVLDTGVPRFAADGQFLGYIGSCVDMTNQKKATERLRESAEFNEKVLASFDSPIAILSRTGKIIAVNNAWNEFSLANGGASSAVGVGVSYLEVCEQGSAAGDVMAGHALAGIHSVLEGARDFFEMEYPCSSPVEFRSFLMRVVPMKTSGGGAVVSHTDVTQLRLAELAARKLHDELAHMQRVNTTGELATTLAHELNQPLGAILRNVEAAELLLQQTPPDYAEVQAILADIKRDDQRAGAVIDQMRTLLKRRDLQFESLGLKELADQVVALVRPELRVQHAKFASDVPDDLLPVRGDRVQLQQVLLNLLMNGLDALEDLPAEQRRLSLSVRSADPQTVEVAVSDCGPGIPAEKLSDIFKPFNTTKSKGLGMGLAISQSIIAAHGGRLWAENNPEGGATFRFTLKVAGNEGPA